MKDYADLVRNSPTLAGCVFLLFFGPGLMDRASSAPEQLRDLMIYVGPSMMVFGGISLIVVVAHMIFRLLYKPKAPPRSGS